MVERRIGDDVVQRPIECQWRHTNSRSVEIRLQPRRKDGQELVEMNQSADLRVTMASELPSVDLVSLSLRNISRDLSTGSIKQSCHVYTAAIGLLALLQQDQIAIRKYR
jgi:hypothetical protein